MSDFRKKVPFLRLKSVWAEEMIQCINVSRHKEDVPC